MFRLQISDKQTLLQTLNKHWTNTYLKRWGHAFAHENLKQTSIFGNKHQTNIEQTPITLLFVQKTEQTFTKNWTNREQTVFKHVSYEQTKMFEDTFNAKFNVLNKHFQTLNKHFFSVCLMFVWVFVCVLDGVLTNKFQTTNKQQTNTQILNKHWTNTCLNGCR